MHREYGLPHYMTDRFPQGETQLRLARAAGFDACYAEVTQPEQIAAFRRDSDTAGAAILWVALPGSVTAHVFDAPDTAEAPEGVRSWEERLARTLSLFDAAESAKIGTVCFPFLAGKIPPVTQKGLERFRLLGREAKARGLRLLFRNGNMAEHFEIVSRLLCPEGHGVCLDPVAACAVYGKTGVPEFCRRSVAALALGDFGGDKLGLLPGEGVLDPTPLIADLAAINYAGALTLAPDPANYPDSRYEDFAAAAYEAVRAFGRKLDDKEGIV